MKIRTPSSRFQTRTAGKLDHKNGGRVPTSKTPAQIGSLALHWDFSDITKVWADTAGTIQITADTAIARVDDLSGNTRHATEADAGERPLYRTSIINSKNAADFDGTDDVLSYGAGFAQAGNYSVFAVCKPDAYAAGTDTLVGQRSNATPANSTISIQRTSATAWTVTANCDGTNAGDDVTGTDTDVQCFIGIVDQKYSLIARWAFEDASSAGSGFANDEISTNDLFGADGWTSIAGKLGNAIRLTPSGLEVTTNDFNFITNPFSVAFWFKRSSGTDTLTLAYAEAIAGRVWAVEIAPTTVAMIVDENGSSPTAFDSVTLPSDTWHFVCARFDAANIYINVNARTEVSAAAITLGDATGGTLTITPSGTVDIDEMIIADRCWTDAEVAALYNNGSGFVAADGYATLYRNGTTNGPTSRHVTINATQPFSIGSRASSPADVFSGLVGEVALFSKALTSEEVVALTAYARAKWGF